MRIVTPDEIEQVAWEGYLEPVGEVYRSGALPKVTLAEPVWWTVDDLETQTGKKWSLPVSGQRFTLIRLACTLHPPERGSAYADARLSAFLRPAGSTGQAVAHDMYPEREVAEQKGKFSVSVGPDLKFGKVNAGLEIELTKVYPVVQAFGLGQPNPYWMFERHRTNPLLGSQYVYAVVAAPQEASAVRLTVELVATVDSGWVPMRFKTPEKAEAHISRLVPLEGTAAGAAVARGGVPNIAVVRDLLHEAFSPHTLRAFCQDRDSFRPLLAIFGPNDGLAAMVGHVVDYCGTRHLWAELLAEVKAEYPRQWERFQGDLEA